MGSKLKNHIRNWIITFLYILSMVYVVLYVQALDWITPGLARAGLIPFAFAVVFIMGFILANYES